MYMIQKETLLNQYTTPLNETHFLAYATRYEYSQEIVLVTKENVNMYVYDNIIIYMGFLAVVCIKNQMSYHFDVLSFNFDSNKLNIKRL